MNFFHSSNFLKEVLHRYFGQKCETCDFRWQVLNNEMLIGTNRASQTGEAKNLAHVAKWVNEIWADHEAQVVKL